MNKLLKVLIVEDSEDDTQLLLRELKKGGYKPTHKRVETAPAMKKALKEQWDIILSDYKMPRFSAPAALKVLQSTNLDIPFIIVSGSVGEDIAVELLKEGAHDFITKMNLSRLVPAIEREMQDCNIRQANKKAEIALEESEHRYKHLFQNHPSPMWVYDIATLKFIDVNDAAIDKYGYSREEFLSMTIFDIRPKKDYERLKENLAKPRAVLQYSGEWRHLLKNGETIFVEITSYLFEDAGKKLSLVVVNDVTASKVAESKLKESEEQYRTLIETMRDGVMQVDNNDVILFTNENMCKMLGYRRDELVGKVGSQVIIYEDDRKMVEQKNKSRKKGVSDSYEVRACKKSGEIIWLNVAGAPVFDNQGRVVGSVGILSDITTRKQAEEALLESEQRYQTLALTSPVGIFRTDTAGLTTYVNPRWCQISGLSPDQALGNGWLKAVHPDDREKLKNNWSESTRRYKGSLAEYRFLRSDGTIVWVMGEAVPEKNLKNIIVGYIGTITDITERKRAEEKIKENELKLRNIFENGTNVFYSHTPDHILTYLSPQIKNVIGYTAEESLKKWTELASDNPVNDEGFMLTVKAIETGEPQLPYELELVHKNGTRVWVEVREAPVVERGKTVQIVGALVDITERKYAEEARIESEKRYREVVENASEIIYTTDVSGNFLYVNPAGLKKMGYTLDEMRRLNYINLTLPEHRARVKRLYYQQYLQKTPSTYVEFPFCVKSGEVGWFGQNGTLLIENGKVIGFQLIGRDITERKQAEEALHESEERFRSLYENSSIGLYRTMPGGEIILANPTLVKMLGHSSFEELAERNLEKEGFEASYERKYFIEQIEKKGEVKGLEAAWIKKDGAIVYVSESAKAIRDSNGKTLFYDGTVEDITERKRAEEALRASESKFRTVADTSAAAIFIYQGEKFVYWNNASRLLTGYSDSEIKDLRFWDLIHPDFRETMKERGLARLRGEEVESRYEFKIIKKTGEERWLDYAAGVIEFEGKPAALGVAFDITEKKKTEEQLKISEQTLRESEERYRSLFEGMLDGVYRSTHDGRFVDVNPAIVQMFGFSSKEEMLSVDIKEQLYFAPSERDSLFLDTGKERTEIFRMRHKDGSEIWVEDHGRYIHDEKRNVIFHEGILRDVTQRLNDEDKLKKSEEKYRDIFTWAPVGIYQTSTDGKFLTANKSLAAILGYDAPEDLFGLNMAKDIYYNSDERKKLIEQFDNKESKSVSNLEILWKKKDGSPIWIMLTSHAVRNTVGKTIYYEGFIADISERKRSEEAMLKLTKAVESSGEVIFMTDPNGIFTYINPEFTKLYGYEPEVAVGKSTPRILKSGAIKQEDYETFWQTLLNNQVVKTELTNKSKDGKLITVETSVNPITDEKQNIIGFLAIQKDITARKKAESALKLQTTYFTQLFENSPSGIAFIDTNDRVMNVNKSFENMFQYSLEEIKGKSLTNLIVPEELVNESHSLSNRVINGELMRTESVRKRKDGTRLDMIITGYPILIEGKCVGIYAIYADVSDIKKLEEQIRQTQKLESLGTLAGGIAHDFNNILGIILGYTSLLGRGYENPEKVKQSVEAISKAVQRGAGLVKQILTFARKTDIVFGPVNVNETIAELVKMLHETFPKTIILSQKLYENLPPIIADHNQIHQALLNLSVNARDAILSSTKNGHRASITFVTKIILGAELRKKIPEVIDEAYVCLSVKDTGSGMDEVTLKRIFEPFFTTKDIGRGTGLGLPVVYGVVKGHRGYIDVESALGVGTTFNLYFPLETQEIEITKNGIEEKEEIKGGTETILLVEDEEMLQELVKAMLEMGGYRVLTANDGEEGIEMYRIHKDEISLVLTDLGLPKLGGFEAFLKMKEINPGIKVVIASGYFDPDQKTEMLKANIKDFAQKPYKPNEVLKTLRNVLDR